MADNTNPTPGATPETPNPKPDADATEDIPEGLGDKGKEALKRERDARKAAEKLLTDHVAELATLRKEREDAATAKAKADEEDAAKRGEFEKLATERGDKLKAVTEERDALAVKVEAYETRDRQRIETGVKDIPDDLKEFDPGADAPLDHRLAWFEKAMAQATKRAGDPDRVKFPATPRPNGNAKPDDDAARKAHQRTTTNAF